MLNQVLSNQEASVPQPKVRNINAIHSYRFKYLRSEHWQNLRIEKLASVDANCRKCKHRDLGNDVHHLRYKKLYDVELTDLVVLCRECHEMVHEALDLCRTYIKSKADTWQATELVMAMMKVSDKEGLPKDNMTEFLSSGSTRAFWKQVSAIRGKRKREEKQAIMDAMPVIEPVVVEQEPAVERKLPPPLWLQKQIGPIFGELRKLKIKEICGILIFVFDLDGSVLYTNR